MIVVDTNTIAYLYLPTQHTDEVEALLDKDSDWVAPLLWRSEFRSILSLHLRKKMVDIDTALEMQEQAEMQFANREYSVNSVSVLTLAIESGCSAYDCEFTSLARTLNTTLITFDKKLIKAFPKTAMTATQYLRNEF